MKSAEYRAVSEQGPSDFAIDVERFDHFCSPPPKNSAPAAGVALGGSNDGAGACTPLTAGDLRRVLRATNFDKARCIVRKGQTVDYMGLRCRVQRVRLGMFWGCTVMTNQPINFPCAWVRVVG